MNDTRDTPPGDLPDPAAAETLLDEATIGETVARDAGLPFTRIDPLALAHRQRMHRPGQLLGQRGIDLPLPRHPADSGEGGALDADVEVALAALAMAGVAPVAFAVVHHLQAGGGEG